MTLSLKGTAAGVFIFPRSFSVAEHHSRPPNSYKCSIGQACWDGALIDVHELTPDTKQKKDGPALAALCRPCDLFWVEEGLIVRTGESGGKSGKSVRRTGKADGFLCPAEKYRWVKRKDGGFVDSDDEDTRQYFEKRERRIRAQGDAPGMMQLPW